MITPLAVVIPGGTRDETFRVIVDTIDDDYFFFFVITLALILLLVEPK